MANCAICKEHLKNGSFVTLDGVICGECYDAYFTQCCGCGMPVRVENDAAMYCPQCKDKWR